MELQSFKNGSLGEIRLVEIGKEVWFIAKDVCDILELTNITETLKRVDEEDLTSVKLNSGNQARDMKAVNESGLYQIVFMSNKPEAKAFKKWVTSEVLPSIRNKGVYATDNFIEQAIANPDYAIRLLTELKEERQARIASENKLAILTHVTKVYTVTEIAKELGFKSAIELNKELNKHKIQFQSNGTWVPYSEYANCGYFDIKQEIMDSGRVIYHRKITQLGREFIINLLS